MDLSLLRQKSEAFIADMDFHIATAFEQNENNLVKLNVNQMLKSKTSKDSTITPKYSAKYEDFKGFPNPNLNLDGNFQKEMFLSVSEKEHFFGSFDFKTPFLTERYSEDIFGIAPSNIAKERKLVGKSLLKLYESKVFL